MKLPKLTAVIEREGEWYVATCPELRVASQGRNFVEAEDEEEIERRLN